MIADRAQETTNTTGTGTLTLAGAVAGYQSFSSAFATGTVVEYAILSGVDWEVGRGTFTTSGTTLSRTTVFRSSNSNALITVAAAAKVWADISADNYASSVQPFRNRLINGAFNIDQGYEGISTTSSASVIGVDGWTLSAAGAGTFTTQRVTDPDNANFRALKIACTVADASIVAADNYLIYTAVEGYDASDLRSGLASPQQITVSFDMKFSVTGTYGVAIHNTGFARTYVGTVTQLVANANESKVLTLTMDTTGTWDYTTGAGLYLSIALATGSTFQTTAGTWQAGNFYSTSAQANFMSSTSNVGYIKRIQLERGPIATPFEEITAQKDLARCQRYYEKSYSTGVTVATGASTPGIVFAPSTGVGTSEVVGTARFRVEKRAAPTILILSFTSGTTGVVSRADGTDLGASTGVGIWIGTDAFTVQNNSGGTITPTLQGFIFHFVASARLA